MSENDFYIGIDIGSYYATASYIDPHTKRPVILDPSGGFSQPYIRTIMAKPAESDEWFIGEEAMHLKDVPGLYIENLLTVFSTDSLYEDHQNTYTKEMLLSIFIEKMIEYIRHINPKAKLCGLCITLVDAIYFEQGTELENHLKHQDFLHLKHVYVRPNSEAAMAFLQHYELIEGDGVLLLDYGHSGFRVYAVTKDLGNNIVLEIANERLGGKEVMGSFYKVIENEYFNYIGKASITIEIQTQIEALMGTYYPYMFKSYKSNKPLKIPFGFAYPPFQGVIAPEVITETLEPFITVFENIMKQVTQQKNIKNIVLTGNGFRMGWPMQQLSTFRVGRIIEDMDSFSKGAAVYAYHPTARHIYKHKGILKDAYGLVVNENTFVPLTKQGHHYQQPSDIVYVTMTREDQNRLVLYKDDGQGNLKPCAEDFIVPQDNNEVSIVGVSIIFDDNLTPSFELRYNPL